jgi:hypothetical protein
VTRLNHEVPSLTVEAPSPKGNVHTNSIEGFWSQLKRSINAATFGGNQFNLPRAKFHESRGLDSDGIVVEHKQHGAVHRLRRDEFWSEILSGIDAISFFTSRR